MSVVVFNVYEPPETTGDRLDRAERLAFVKDGFHWWAALVPVIWLPIKGLWIEFLVFLVGVGVITWFLEAIGVSNEFVSVLLLIVQIVIGFEATNIQGAALERRGWRMAGTVTGRSREDCEVRFLTTWLNEQPQASTFPSPPLGDDTFATPMQRPTSWLGAALYDVKDSFNRGRRMART